MTGWRNPTLTRATYHPRTTQGYIYTGNRQAFRSAKFLPTHTDEHPTRMGSLRLSGPWESRNAGPELPSSPSVYGSVPYAILTNTEKRTHDAPIKRKCATLWLLFLAYNRRTYFGVFRSCGDELKSAKHFASEKTCQPRYLDHH